MKRYIIIDNRYFLIKETKKKTKILSLLKERDYNISELSKKLKIAYNNLFIHINGLIKDGLVVKRKTINTKNNPTVISLREKVKDD